MRTPEEIMSELAARVKEPDSPVADIGVMRFDLSGEHGGSWLMCLTPLRSIAAIEPTARSAPSDCTFRLADTDFVSLLEGRVTGQQLFFDGRLEVDGDLSMTLKLPALTRALRRTAAHA